MTKFFQVLSNLKNNGTLHKAGEVIEEELENVEALVKSGVLKLIEEAKSLEHAGKIVAKEAADKANEPVAEEIPPEDTWGPKPIEDEEKETETPPTENTPNTEEKPAEKPVDANVEAPKDDTTPPSENTPVSASEPEDDLG